LGFGRPVQRSLSLGHQQDQRTLCGFRTYFGSRHRPTLWYSPRGGISRGRRPQLPSLRGSGWRGIWRTDRPFSREPRWRFTSNSFATNAIGTIAIDPRNPDVIYAGTGEPNASADSAAGLGLYRSRNGGEDWEHLSSTLTFSGPGGPLTVSDGFNNLSISDIVFDPTARGTFYVATTLGVRALAPPLAA